MIRRKSVKLLLKSFQQKLRRAKAESFTTFSGAESNTYSAFGKFRRVLVLFLASISAYCALLLDETAQGPFSAEANEVLFAILNRFHLWCCQVYAGHEPRPRRTAVLHAASLALHAE